MRDACRYDSEARQGGRRWRGDRRLQRRIPPDTARVAGHRRRRPGPALRDRRLHVPRPGPRLPDQPLQDDDELCSLHRRPVVAAGTRRRSVRQGRGQLGGGLDARAASRPETKGWARP